MSLQHQLSTQVESRNWFRRVARRAAVFAVLWGILTDGNSSSWAVGIPVIVMAAIVSVMLLPHHGWRWRFPGFARFLPFFLLQSLRGSIDVARRAFSPGLPLNPRLLHYDIRLSHGSARVFFANVVSLLPGTLSVELRDKRLVVHVLDAKALVFDELRSVESAVAALFGSDMNATARNEEHAHV